MLKVIIEGLPGEIAALVEAVQDQPEIRAIRRKPYEEMTAEDHIRLNNALDDVCPTVPVYTDKDLLG